MAKKPPIQDQHKIIDAICEEIANSDKSLWEICDEIEGVPTARTIARWIADDETICQKYARAKELQADFMAGQIRAIADECRLGVKTVKKESGTETTTGDMVDRSRLQIDARKWLASKLAPKKYGDRLTHSGDSDNPVEIKADVVVRPSITREEWLKIHGLDA